MTSVPVAPEVSVEEGEGEERVVVPRRLFQRGRVRATPLTPRSPGAPRSVIQVILNPVSGAGAARRLLEGRVAPRCEEGQIDLRVRETEAAGDFARFAASMDFTGVDIVAIMGGDGSVHEFLQGVRDRPRRLGPVPPVAVVPTGTGNVLARDLSRFTQTARNASVSRAIDLALSPTAALVRPDVMDISFVGPSGPQSVRGIFAVGVGPAADLFYFADEARRRGSSSRALSVLSTAVAGIAHIETPHTLRLTLNKGEARVVSARAVMATLNQSSMVGRVNPRGVWDDGAAEVLVAPGRKGVSRTLAAAALAVTGREEREWPDGLELAGEVDLLHAGSATDLTIQRIDIPDTLPPSLSSSPTSSLSLPPSLGAMLTVDGESYLMDPRYEVRVRVRQADLEFVCLPERVREIGVGEREGEGGGESGSGGRRKKRGAGRERRRGKR